MRFMNGLDATRLMLKNANRHQWKVKFDIVVPKVSISFHFSFPPTMDHKFIFLFSLFLITVNATILYVQNKCPSSQPVAFRGAYGTVYYEGTINSGNQYVVEVNSSSCSSCNIGINTGKTLLAECMSLLLFILLILFELP